MSVEFFCLREFKIAKTVRVYSMTTLIESAVYNLIIVAARSWPPSFAILMTI